MMQVMAAHLIRCPPMRWKENDGGAVECDSAKAWILIRGGCGDVREFGGGCSRHETGVDDGIEIDGRIGSLSFICIQSHAPRSVDRWHWWRKAWQLLPVPALHWNIMIDPPP
jgi:hypothetical protein